MRGEAYLMVSGSGDMNDTEPAGHIEEDLEI